MAVQSECVAICHHISTQQYQIAYSYLCSVEEMTVEITHHKLRMLLCYWMLEKSWMKWNCLRF